MTGPRRALEATGESGLRRVIERARMLDEIDRRLRLSLPPALAQQCRLANVRDDRLVFLVSSPVWKTKLRLHEDVLVDAARLAGLPARSLTVKVATMQPVPPNAASRLPLSQATRDALRATAESVADPELRAQLLLLASVP